MTKHLPSSMPGCPSLSDDEASALAPAKVVQTNIEDNHAHAELQ